MRLITSVFATLMLFAGTANAGFILNGSDLLTDSNTTLSGTAGFAANGTSLTYNGSSNGRVYGIISDVNSGVSSAGDSYSLTVDVTQITGDTDFGWAVTDGVNVWGMLTYDIGISLAEVFGSYGGLNSSTSINYGTGMQASGIPGVGNSGTMNFDFLFDATSTTITISGDYYNTISNGTFVNSNTFTFGNTLSVLLLSGGGGERYQLDSIKGSGSTINAVPAPTSLLALSIGLIALVAARRK